jgi:hypothetical protein
MFGRIPPLTFTLEGCLVGSGEIIILELGDLPYSFATPPFLFKALNYSLASSILIYLLYSIILLKVSINLA